MGFYKDYGDDNNMFLIGCPHRNKYDIYNTQSVVYVPASRYGKKWVLVSLGGASTEIEVSIIEMNLKKRVAVAQLPT